MKTRMSLKRWCWILGGFLVIAAVHHVVFRPWFLDWGATERIQKLPLTGDKFTGDNSHTRAVLIEATPNEIWPWIIQLGQDRGGMYSYTWLENIFFADMPNVSELKTEFQLPRSVGDTIWLANPDHYKGQGYQILAAIEGRQSFVMVGGSDYSRILQGQKGIGSWAIYLYPEDKNSTWLIARSSSDDPGIGSRVLRYVIYEVPHFIMEKKMLKKIRDLASQ